MVKITQSLAHWLFENGYEKEMALISFGHVELFTSDMQKEYLKWCDTEDGKQYLKGGIYYTEPS
jgi:hypothetical protein